MNQVISMCIVPVKVRIKGSQGAVKTWAMLDNCSQGSFVKTNLLEELKGFWYQNSSDNQNIEWRLQAFNNCC